MLRYGNMRLLFFLLIISFTGIISGYGQQVQDSGAAPCITNEMNLMRNLPFPSQPQFKKEEIEDEGQVFVIPVVFHVIHNGGVENIPDSSIYRQVSILNEDFGRYGRGANTNPLSRDAGIRFCLVSRDSLGNPHPGIIRVKSPYTDLKRNQELLTKNLSRWNPSRYLNIWVVKSIDGSSSTTTTKGYAYYPPGAVGQPFDGIVITYDVVGYNRFSLTRPSRGHACSHEAGHYFNLDHTWGPKDINDDCQTDDGIDDTPPCIGPYFSNPAGSCAKPSECGFPRMIENYMDYADDKCRNLFTNGQVERMRGAIEIYRYALVRYPNSVVAGCEDNFRSFNAASEKLEIHPNPAHAYIYLYPNFSAVADGELTVFDMTGRPVLRETVYGLLKERIKINLPPLAQGLYEVVVKTPDHTYRSKVVVTGN